MPWIYVIHFERGLHHARHYTGSTDNLERRLHDHAMGYGSRLTHELYLQGIDWVLGGLYQGKNIQQSIREIEKRAKNRHNGPHHCLLCQESLTIAPKGTFAVPFPKTFPTDSESIRRMHAKVR